jgi:23S rRNA (adenine2503-C2)-methyltransferase
MQLMYEQGQPDVATVLVGRPRADFDAAIECVDGLDPPKPRREKWIVNVSTQFGCPIGCVFCDAGGSYRGNLTAAEILDQVRAVLARHPEDVAECAKLKVHFSRVGEPALNDAVLTALRALPCLATTPGLWACLATCAPRGAEPWFDKLARVQRAHYPGRFQLQFSVNTTDEKLRLRLMPYPLHGLDWLARRGPLHFQPGDRKVLLNFALAHDVPVDPAAIVSRFDPAVFAVKLTPLNPTARSQANQLRTRLDEGVAPPDDLVAPLRQAGFDVVLSIGDRREDIIGSNCGQALLATETPKLA